MRRGVAMAFALGTAAVLAACGTSADKGSSTAAAIARPGIDDTSYAGRSYAGDAVRGQLVFNTNCATCHGTDGRSGGVGPSLIDENQRQDLARTIVWIENPEPPMPKLYPSPLAEEDVEDVAAFVQSVR